VLGDRDARLYLAGVVVSGLGSSAMWLVAGVWVKDLTGSDALAALCALALWAPLLAGPLLGTLADRPHRRALLITTDLFLAATTRPSRPWSPRPSPRRSSATSTACA
jgi:MFS family permease